MYIFELLYKNIVKIIQKKEQTPIENENTQCEHIFLPVDSTKKILACTKCGQLIKNENTQAKQQKSL